MKESKSTQLNCFSPPVMVATFIIEIVLAIYTMWRYKLNTLGRLVVAMLGALAFFQLCEYHVCRGVGLSATEWSRGGFVAITLLPALGTHLLHVLTNKLQRKLVVVAYVLMAAFIMYFIAAPKAFSGYACTGNYVIFQIGIRPAIFYAMYYYGFLALGLMLGMHWANQLKSQGSAKYNRLLAVRALMIGYLVFLVPTALANSINPATRRGIPSVMCGFAVLFALILTLYIMPRLAQKRT